jgi:type II secretory pathway component PulF
MPLLALVLELLVHALCWTALLVAWVVVPARLEHTFRDYNMKLPWGTQMVMSLWRTTGQFFVLMPLFLLLILAADGVILYLLRRDPENRTAARVWFWAMLLVPFLLAVVPGLALSLAYLKLLEGLSR